MAFSIQTNVNCLIAQENLRVNSEFQSRTIQRLTSGFRINQSGDDAAGLAIANKFRSDMAELTQGVRNANDGISTLQIVDGGMNNISKMLDRLKTLATQSASGTFTGDRNVLNNEFQSVLSEIDRQAQAIGLEPGRPVRQVAFGVHRRRQDATPAAVDIANGSVTVDLSSSTVDASSLGLKGMQAASVAGTDLSASTATSVANILANTNNLNSQRTAGFSEFYFSGAGFSGADKIRISINTSAVADTATAVEAINAAIESAAGQPTEAAQAFAAAGLKASVVTTDGKETIAFTSSSAAFQVEAGDKVANALLGNFQAGAEGKAVSQTITSVGVTAAGAGTLAANQKIVVRIAGRRIGRPGGHRPQRQRGRHRPRWPRPSPRSRRLSMATRPWRRRASALATPTATQKAGLHHRHRRDPLGHGRRRYRQRAGYGLLGPQQPDAGDLRRRYHDRRRRRRDQQRGGADLQPGNQPRRRSEGDHLRHHRGGWRDHRHRHGPTQRRHRHQCRPDRRGSQLHRRRQPVHPGLLERDGVPGE